MSGSDDVLVLIAELSGEECRAALVEVASDPEVAANVMRLSAELLGSFDASLITAQVADELLALSHFEIGQRSGRQPYSGYVEPTQAAWDILEEAIEPWVCDVERRALLGHVDAGTGIAVSVVAGLFRCLSAPDETVLSWVPDAPEHLAGELVDRAEQAGVVFEPGALKRVAPDWF